MHSVKGIVVTLHCLKWLNAIHCQTNPTPSALNPTHCAAQEAEVVALPRIIVKRWKDAGIDVLVNNAGLGRNDASLFDGNTASWVEMVSTNTLGVCMCTREAVQVRLWLAMSSSHTDLCGQSDLVCVRGGPH